MSIVSAAFQRLYKLADNKQSGITGVVMYGAKSLVDYSAVGVFQNFNLIAEIIKYSYKKVPVNRDACWE